MSDIIKNKSLLSVAKEFRADRNQVLAFFVSKGDYSFFNLPSYTNSYLNNLLITPDMYNLMVKEFNPDKYKRVKLTPIPLGEKEFIYFHEIIKKHQVGLSCLYRQFQYELEIDVEKDSKTMITQEMYQKWLKSCLPKIEDMIHDAIFSSESPQAYGYRNSADMELGEVWEGDIDAYNAHNG